MIVKAQHNTLKMERYIKRLLQSDSSSAEMERVIEKKLDQDWIFLCADQIVAYKIQAEKYLIFLYD